MSFELRALPIPEVNEPGFWFIFDKDMLLVEKKNNKISIPYFENIDNLDLDATSSIYLGRLDSYPCFAALQNGSGAYPENFSFEVLRPLFRNLDDELFWLAARAYHLVNWDQKSRYCGQCGKGTQLLKTEHAKACPECGLVVYPKISPAIIVAITKGEKILLARGNRFTSKFYSILAGFVEPGENLEECVKREVLEEVGIRVDNIRYFGSQPWPFPDSLMLGFTAEYAGGELKPDPSEILTVDWFSADNLPEIPGPLSIARRLIDNFIENHR